MREELSDDELDTVVGGVTFNPANCSSFDMEAIRNKVETEPMKSWWFF
jgi:bacteriocin-like protein